MALNSPCGLPRKWRDSINCGCKINLRLKVTGCRPDGLHDLSSCFLFLDEPGDMLTIESCENGMVLETPGYPELAGRNNLVWRAAEKFAEAGKITPDWRIILKKNVPLAAGLGGGSADAAGVLLLLNRHYQLFDAAALEKMAFSLGADVPFFLSRKAAWVSGAGENIEIIEKLPDLPQILIVNPAFPVSAKWAYTHLDKALIGADDPAMKESFLSGKVNWSEFCRNDLAAAVMEKFPLLKLLAESLYDYGALKVLVSGSGPSLFALFDIGAAGAAEKLRREYSGFEMLKIFLQESVQ